MKWMALLVFLVGWCLAATGPPSQNNRRNGGMPSMPRWLNGDLSAWLPSVVAALSGSGGSMCVLCLAGCLLFLALRGNENVSTNCLWSGFVRFVSLLVMQESLKHSNSSWHAPVVFIGTFVAVTIVGTIAVLIQYLLSLGPRLQFSPNNNNVPTEQPTTTPGEARVASEYDVCTIADLKKKIQEIDATITFSSKMKKSELIQKLKEVQKQRAGTNPAAETQPPA